MTVGFDFRKRLGFGHFGEVWHAIDLGLDVECAVKLIPPDKVINQQNFFQEAQTLKAAEHPNIIQVTETGEFEDGRIYVVMEFLREGSLEDETEGGYVPVSRAKRVMIDVLRGLEHAHSKGIVHRDVKPANIMIGGSGEGKLSDFGLALPDISSLDLSAVKGYQYLLHRAPEVRSFKDYTALADVYACGVTLYRMVNGDSVLPALAPHEAVSKAREGKFPDRKRYRGFVPMGMKKVINRAMAVDPNERYQSVEEMRRALERVYVAADWDEHVLLNGKRWKGMSRNRDLELTRFQESDGTWSVTLRKCKSGGTLRKDTKFCKTGLNEKQATREAYRVLQQFVSGKA